jgi:DNA repair protein XRS2
MALSVADHILFQRNLRSRSTVTIEDLESKKGTLLNGVQIRGQKKALSEDVNELKLGMCPKRLR